VIERKWVRGANGLWSSYDAGCKRARLREIARERIAGIAERLDAVIKRDGWERRGNRWRKAEGRA
jgi:hypothetical protein